MDERAISPLLMSSCNFIGRGHKVRFKKNFFSLCSNDEGINFWKQTVALPDQHEQDALGCEEEH